MKLNKLLVAGTAALAISAAAGSAFAQETTSAVRGTVTDESGAPISGAVVSIINEQTGFSRTLTTAGNGQFSARNLPIGGSYVVVVESDGYQGERVEDLALSLGDTTNLTFDLAIESGTDEIIIVAQRNVGDALALGPSSTFGLDTLENAPAANRDLKDIVRIDPRVYVDAAFVDAINCAGANPRYNSLTVDGVRMNDNFGLNSNGYPTERIPFSYDAIDQVAVELAPFDVEYGSFTACNINAVTKSGTNEFHGGAFFDYTSDALTGDKTDGIDRDTGDFDEYRYGINVGGPIIKDKLFFFAAYEKLEGVNQFGRTPADVNITDAQFNEIIQIAEDQYGYVSGGLPSAMDVEDEKFLAKIDWNINDDHRATFTYNYNDGFNFSESDGGSTQISDGNHYYERGAKLESYAGAIFSDWTDNLSTEFRVSYLDLDNRQLPVAGTDFGEIQVRVGSTTVYLGADDSRQANKLTYDLWNYKGKADYQWGDHLITAGIEREEFEVYNLFLQELEGEWRFSSIADFANGDFNYFEYSNASGTNNKDDVAAQFGYEITTAYLQDEWTPTSALTLTGGVRVDFYTSDDKPNYNSDFHSKYGIRNDDNLDGKSLVQPRFGFNYEFSDAVSFRGGFGLYSGGNPNVWISNNYSNDGVTLIDYQVRGGNIADFTYPNSGNVFYEVPQEGIDYIADATNFGGVNALDPNYEIPSEWKYALGSTMFVDTNTFLGNDYVVNLDLLYSKTNEASVVLPISYTKTGEAPDGRPIYGGSTSDFLLTNAEDKGQALVLSGTLSKDYDNGIDWTLGYAYTDAEDTNPMTSSVAFSNFANYTTADPVNPVTATSDYEIAHRFTLNANYEREFIAGLESRFSLFGTFQEGAPYSYVFARNSTFESPFTSNRQLAYIPDGYYDPNIDVAASDADALAALLAFIDGDDDLADFRGEIADRNAFADSWNSVFDIKFTQELPGLREGDKASAFIVIKNVGNLLNDEWGIFKEHGFPGNAELYTASITPEGKYAISSFNSSADNESIVVNPSLWSIRIGAKYDF